MASDLEINIIASTKEAEKALNQFSKNASSSLSAVEQSFGFLKTAAQAAIALVAVDTIFNAISKVTKAASEQESAINSLNLAMAASGRYSDAASKTFVDFSETIQKTTGIDDGLVISQLAIAESFARSNEEAQKLVKAAIQLSSVTGQDLGSSVMSLGKTLEGTEGSLGRMIPAVKSLSEAQLKHGEAIDYVLKKYSGIAEGKLNTFDGAVKNLHNSFEDINKSIGETIIKNPALISIINKAADIFEKFKNTIEENKDAMSSWLTDAIKLAISSLPGFLTVIKYTAVGINVLTDGFLALIGVAETIKIAFSNLGSFLSGAFKVSLNAVYGGFLETINGILKLINEIPFVSDAFSKMGIDIKGTIESIQTQIDGSSREIAKQYIAAADEMNKTDPFNSIKKTDEIFSGLDKAIDSTRSEMEMFNSSIQKMGSTSLDSGKKAVEQLQKQFVAMKMNEDEIKKLVELGVANPIITPTQAREIIKPIVFEINSTIPGKLGQVAGGILAMVSGLDGATKLIATTIGTFADTLLPGVGGAISKIITIFALGPGFVKDLVVGFINGIPDIIDNIIAALPAIFEAIINVLGNPNFWIKMSAVFVKAALLYSAGVQLAAAYWSTAVELSGSVWSTVISVAGALWQAAVALAGVIWSAVVAVAGALWEAAVVAAGVAFAAIMAALSVLWQAAMLVGAVILVEKIAELLTPVIQDLGYKITEAVNSLQTGIINALMPVYDLIKSLGTAISEGATALFNGIKQAADQFLGTILDSAGQFLTQILNGLRDGIDNIFKSLGNIFGGGGGGGNLIQNAADVLIGGVSGILNGAFGHASGGTVPSGYPNDNFPANLTSGEMIIPQRDTERLNSFLTKQETNQTSNQDILRSIDNSSQRQLTINLQIGEKELASVLLDLNRRGFRTT